MTHLLLPIALLLGPAAAGPDPVPVPEPSAKALSYYRSGVPLWFIANAWTIGLPAAIVATGLSARLRDLARRVGKTRYATFAAYLLLYLGLVQVLEFPLDYLAGYARSRAYGLSDQPLGRWLGNLAKSLGVTAVVGLAVGWVPYAIMARSSRYWWAWTALLLLPMALLGATIMPVVVDPIFNRFGPMRDQALEAKILHLAGRAGVVGMRVFVVDKSQDTKTVNAYVTGLLGTRRVVLWDTLLQRLDPDEVLAVVGHEIGHYALNHVAVGVSLASAGGFLLLFLVDQIGRGLIRRYHRRFGFDRLGDVASIPLILALVAGLNLVGNPIRLAVSRAMEHEADRFGLELTRANRPAATSFAKMVDDNLAIPRPGRLTVLWRSSHPPLGERIDFCNAYRPWSEGRPGVYFGRVGQIGDAGGWQADRAAP